MSSWMSEMLRPNSSQRTYIREVNVLLKTIVQNIPTSANDVRVWLSFTEIRAMLFLLFGVYLACLPARPVCRLLTIGVTLVITRLIARGPSLPLPLEEVEGKVIFITGASNGIGLKVAQLLLLLRPARIVFAVRGGDKRVRSVRAAILKEVLPSFKEGEQKSEEAAGKLATKITGFDLDLTSFASVRKLVESLKSTVMAGDNAAFDIVILNAGITQDKVLRTDDGWDVTVQTNILSHILLMDLFKKNNLLRSHPISSQKAVSEGEVKTEAENPLPTQIILLSSCGHAIGCGFRTFNEYFSPTPSKSNESNKSNESTGNCEGIKQECTCVHKCAKMSRCPTAGLRLICLGLNAKGSTSQAYAVSKIGAIWFAQKVGNAIAIHPGLATTNIENGVSEPLKLVWKILTAAVGRDTTCAARLLLNSIALFPTVQGRDRATARTDQQLPHYQDLRKIPCHADVYLDRSREAFFEICDQICSGSQCLNAQDNSGNLSAKLTSAKCTSDDADETDASVSG